ncbi:hypothetical protein EDB84DRAFT_1442213 [Lactarius hengduanensis]|nr:hypothetical protein EDB84DRAFT_1442213 [Lactarius hengduanensis]
MARENRGRRGRLALVRPFPREGGATGWGRLALAGPFPRVPHGAARGKDGAGGWRALAYRAARPKGAVDDGVRGRHGSSPSVRKRKGGTGVACPLAARTGRCGHGGRGAAEGDGERERRPRAGRGRGWRALTCTLPVRVRGGVPLYTSLPRAWERVGPGIACPRVPLPARTGRRGHGGRGRAEGDGERGRRAHANGKGGGGVRTAARSKGKGRGRGRRGEGAACWSAPLPRECGRVGPGRVPPCRARGAARSRGHARCRRRRRGGGGAPLVRTPSAQTGKGGAGGGVPSRVPFPLPARRGGAVKGEGEGRRALVLSAAKGEREGPGATGIGGGDPPREWGTAAAACPRANGKGGRGWWWVPSCAPLQWAARAGGTGGGEGEGWRALVRPLSAQTGRGAAGCPCAALPREWDGGTWEKGRGPEGGNVPSYAPLERGGGSMRRAGEGEEGGRLTLVHPCLRTNGAAGDVGERSVGPSSCVLYANGAGGGDGREEGGGKTYALCINPILYWEGMGGKVGVACPRAHTLWRKQNGTQEGRPTPRIARREGRTRIRGTQCPSASQALPSPPPAPPRLRGRGAHEGMPSPLFSLSAAPHCGKRAHEGTWPPPLPFPLGRAIRKGGTRPPAPPFPIRAEGRTRPPPPFPLAAPPHSRRMGACEGKTRGKGTLKGTRVLGPSLPHSRGRGAHEGTPLRVALAPFSFSLRATRHARHATPRPSPSPLGRAAPYARGTRGHATLGSTLPHSHAAPGPSPLAAPPRTRGKWACEAPPPAPPFPHWRGRVLHAGTPPSTSLPPWPRRPVRARRGHARAFARKGVHAGTPPPSRGKGRTRASRPRLPTYRAAGSTRSRRARVHRARTAIFARHSTT